MGFFLIFFIIGTVRDGTVPYRASPQPTWALIPSSRILMYSLRRALFAKYDHCHPKQHAAVRSIETTQSNFPGKYYFLT